MSLPPKDLTGQKFGKWLALGPAPSKKYACGTKTFWLCRCDCGIERAVSFDSLRAGKSSGCGCLRKMPRGEKSPNWRGGRYSHIDGYVVIRSPDGLRLSLEHIVVMEKHLGRQLREEETVHHKNGIRSDNRLDNLELWASNHPSGQRVEDLTTWAIELLSRYAPEKLS